MKKIEKIFIAVGLIIILLICGATYANNKLNHLFDNWGLIEAILSQEGLPQSDPLPVAVPGAEEPEAGPKGSAPQNQPSLSAEDLLNDEDIEAIIQNKLSKPIEQKDKIKVALILIRNLSTDDIIYFYDLVTSGYTRDDIRQVRAILTANLSKEDMEILRSMAVKYGFSL